MVGKGSPYKARSWTSSTRSDGFIEGLRIQGGIKHGPLEALRATTEDGQKWTKRGNGPWTRVKKVESPSRQGKDDMLQLVLVMQRQDVGEPDHWFLLVAKEGRIGDVYQIKRKKSMIFPINALRCVKESSGPSG